MANTRSIQDETQKQHAKMLGKRLRYWRNMRGKTMQELAATLGISQQQLQKYEKGYNRLSVYRLEQIIGCLEVSMPTVLQTDLSEPDGDKRAWSQLWQRLETPQKRLLAQKMGEVIAQG